MYSIPGTPLTSCSIENVGDTPLKILIALNSGDYQEIDLGQWMAGNPADVLATNFGRPAATFRRFPTRDAFIE
jgi:oxalate decarboxylase